MEHGGRLEGIAGGLERSLAREIVSEDLLDKTGGFFHGQSRFRVPIPRHKRRFTGDELDPFDHASFGEVMNFDESHSEHLIILRAFP